MRVLVFTLAILQAVVSSHWDSQAIEPLMVTIQPTATGPCVASGFIVGYDQQRVYAATAYAALSTAGVLTSKVFVGSKPAHVFHADPDLDLVVLDIADAGLVKSAQQLSFDVLGDPKGLVRKDSVYSLGCTASQRMVRWPPRFILMIANDGDKLLFQGPDLTDIRTGGPLVHLLGSHSTIVGLTTAYRERGEATNLVNLLDRMRVWHVPVMLRPPETKPGCTYELSFSKPPQYMIDTTMVMFASNANERNEVTVRTAPTCTWSAYADAAPWMQVSLKGQDPPLKAPSAIVNHTGQGTVVLRTTMSNQCENKFLRGSVQIAGHVVPISQDSTDLGRCR
jgi:hypothetical protein